MAASLPLLLLLLCALGATAKRALPPYVRPCSVKDPVALSECAMQRAREILPQVMEGDAAYGVPALDPLRVARLQVDDGAGPLGVHLVATDALVHGLRQLRVDRIAHGVDPPEDVYEVTIPELLITSKYNMSGRILLMPITGFGDSFLSMSNVRLSYRFPWALQRLEDGEVYYLPRPGARLDLDVDSMRIHLENLFNGEKTLGESTNAFLNERWRDVFDALRPAFTQAISDVITGILYGIYRQVPYKDAFLDTGY